MQIAGDAAVGARRERARSKWLATHSVHHFSFVAPSGIFFASDFMKFHNVEATGNTVFRTILKAQNERHELGYLYVYTYIRESIYIYV